MESARYGPVTRAVSANDPCAGMGPMCPRKSSSSSPSERAAMRMPASRSVKKVLSTSRCEVPASMLPLRSTILLLSMSTAPVSRPEANSNMRFGPAAAPLRGRSS